MTRRQTILVTDGEHRAALAVVRSLGRAGHDVEVVSPLRRSLAGASRYTRGCHRVAEPLAEPDRFVDDVRRVIRECGVEMVIPITDAALFALLSQRDDLGAAVLPWPDEHRVRDLADKALVTEAARELAIRVPRQRQVGTADEAIEAARHVGFPVVLKPSRSVRESTNGRLSTPAVTYAGTSRELEARVAELEPAAYPLLVQERVVGPGIGVACLIRHGRLLAHFAHRRIRERPVAGGVSVYAESIAPNDALVERSIALLRRFDWDGVAMVEYKLDTASGEPYFMEVNGRFWGSLQLAIDAGVDFPALLVAATQGSVRTSEAPAYRAGVRFRWWWGDVDHLLIRLARSAERLSLPPGAPSRLEAVRQFIAAGLPHRDSDALQRDDPRPFIVDTRDWLRGRLHALRQGPRSPSLPARRAGAAASTVASPAR